MQEVQHRPQQNWVDGNMAQSKSFQNTSTESKQNFDPITNIGVHVTTIHCHCGNPSNQMLCHGYSARVNEDLTQALIYDSTEKNARLIGVEYIISESAFKSLPDEETKFWHSHSYILRSGIGSCPGMPKDVEKEALSHLVNTYGKTLHLWQVEKGDKLPVGAPKVMMVPIKDDQVNWNLIKQRDKDFGLDYKQLQQERKELQYPEVDPRADAWAKTGKAVYFDVREESIKID